MFSEGIFLTTEDCERVSSYIPVHMVTMMLKRCKCWTGAGVGQVHQQKPLLAY